MNDDSSTTQATDISGFQYKGKVYCSEHIISQLPTGEGQEFDGWQLAAGIVMAPEQNLREIAASFYFATDMETISSDVFPKAITAEAMPDDSYCAVCQRELDSVEPSPALGSLLDFDGVASFDAAELGLEDLGMVSFVDVAGGEQHSCEPGQLSVSVYVSEQLQFHADRNPELFTRADESSAWETTAETWAVLSPLLASRYGAEVIEEDSGVVSFQLSLTVSDSLPLDQLGKTIWEKSKLVQLSNETDPGTFGSPYLFGSVFSEAREAGSADAS